MEDQRYDRQSERGKAAGSQNRFWMGVLTGALVMAFVGLIIPHMTRKLADNDYRKLLPLCFLGGSVLMVWADLAARLVNQPYETPVGLITSVLGVPVFLWMIRKEKNQ